MVRNALILKAEDLDPFPFADALWAKSLKKIALVDLELRIELFETTMRIDLFLISIPEQYYTEVFLNRQIYLDFHFVNILSNSHINTRFKNTPRIKRWSSLLSPCLVP